MITIQEALEIVLSQPLKRIAENLPVGKASGRVIAQKISSPLDLPSFDNSAMDGYAVCGTGDVFSIIGEIAAGDTAPYQLNEGEALRIFTGAKVPENTTAVIMQEKTEVVANQLKISDVVVEGKNIRRRGEEIARGQTVFLAGQRISPATAGLLSSLGLNEVSVYRTPRVGILTTGDELVKPGDTLSPGQIYESNGPALQAAVEWYGFECRSVRHEKDDFDTIKSSIAEFLQEVDVLLISGGISVGEYDFSKKALEENGVRELFYKVKQKPGKPLFFGRRNDAFVFALPGNPASALTCFYVYALPFLQKLTGNSRPGLFEGTAPLAREYELKSDRPTFLKAQVQDEVTILDQQSSSMLYSMATGNALVLLTGPRFYQKGDQVKYLLL